VTVSSPTLLERLDLFHFNIINVDDRTFVEIEKRKSFATKCKSKIV